MHTHALANPVSVDVMGQKIALTHERFYFNFNHGGGSPQIVATRVLGVLRDPAADPNGDGNFVAASQYVPDETLVLQNGAQERVRNPSFDASKPEGEDNPRFLTITTSDLAKVTAANGPKKQGAFRPDDVVTVFRGVKKRREEAANG